MATETYNFKYSSKNGWEGDFDKLDQLEESLTGNSHSGKKPRFSIVLAVTVIIIIIVGILYSLNVIPHPQRTAADFNIETYHSQIDKDNDGIDDQTDILQSAREYLATNPKYQSKYYATGYPDDNYGVCTDVVAFALKGAGYNLMRLVAQDIQKYPEAYNIDTPDQNIDFRRVKNLQTYFERHATRLTTDRNNISEWQGGDIVVFEDHIGLVSDHRNKHGIPFLIHHYSPIQTSYEEDVLSRYVIVGHYRIS